MQKFLRNFFIYPQLGLVSCSEGDALVDEHYHPGRCRHLGYLRNFLAEGDCSAGVASIVIPGYAERWGYESDKYQVYVRFVLIDTVTGYRSQYQEGAFIIKAW